MKCQTESKKVSLHAFVIITAVGMAVETDKSVEDCMAIVDQYLLAGVDRLGINPDMGTLGDYIVEAGFFTASSNAIN